MHDVYICLDNTCNYWKGNSLGALHRNSLYVWSGLFSRFHVKCLAHALSIVWRQRKSNAAKFLFFSTSALILLMWDASRLRTRMHARASDNKKVSEMRTLANSHTTTGADAQLSRQECNYGSVDGKPDASRGLAWIRMQIMICETDDDTNWLTCMTYNTIIMYVTYTDIHWPKLTAVFIATIRVLTWGT